MARVNIDILGISELKWAGMGEFNSDDHCIYYCGQESLRRKGVAITNKRVWNAVLGCNLRNDRMISVHASQRHPGKFPKVPGRRRGKRGFSAAARERPEIKLPTSAGSSKKQESSRKTSISALLTMPKPLIVWITINCGEFWKRWEYQTTWPAPWEICMKNWTWNNRLVPNRKRST